MTDKQQQRSESYQIIRRREVESLTGLSRSSIYLRIANGRFPKPVNLGGRAVGWVEAEIQGCGLKNRSRSARHRPYFDGREESELSSGENPPNLYGGRSS